MSAAERLLDSLRDLLYAWTHRFTSQPSSRAGVASRRRKPQAPPPRVDMHALVERHEIRRTTRGCADAAPVRERVTMHDHAVSRIFDRRVSEPDEWGE